MAQIKWQLQIIFIYYTSYADRNNFRLLKQQNYRRFLIDSDTIKSQSSLVHYDLAFQKISHSAIIFKDFLDLVPDIAQILYKKLNRAEAFKLYIRKHMQPLYNEILQKSDFGHDVAKINDSMPDPKLHKTVRSITALQKIYMQHVGKTRHAKDTYQIFQTFITLLKQCELSPQLIPKSMAYILYLSLIKEQNQDDIFNFHDFVTALIIISQICEKKVSNIELCEIGKMTKILQRIQISEGFQKISKKIVYETAITPSILKPFLEANKQSDHVKQSEEEYSRVFPASTRHKNCNSSFNFSSSKEKLQKDNYNSVKDAIEQESISFSKQSREIKQAFEELCSYGEVANIKTLKSIKIKKLFQRTGFISVVGKTWLDIQIVNLQRSSGTGKIEFPQFLQLLSVTANKVNAPFSEICRLVLEDKQNNDHQMIEQSMVSHAVGQYSNEDQQILKGILSQAEKQLEKVYLFYTLQRKLMSFSELSKCMYDFDIFPGIISKSRLFHIFSALSDVRQQNQSQSIIQKESISSRVKTLDNYLKDEKMIQFSGFLLAVIEIAQQICDPQLQSPQKLIVLLEKVNDTKGYKGISSISLVKEIRKKFGSYYAASFKKQPKHVQDFQELLNGIN